jgi:hypothetical protein
MGTTMNRRTLALLIVLVAAGAAGCAPDRMVLEPYCVCAMPATCSFSGSCAACSLGAQTFNPGLGDSLYGAIELRNQAPNNEDVQTGRVNSNDAHVTGYSLTYTTGGPASVTLYEGNQPIPAEGVAVVWVKLAPPGAPAGKYSVEVSFIGYYDNGREFETEPFPIGLEVGAFTFGCSGTNVDVCPGTGAQGNAACGAP